MRLLTPPITAYATIPPFASATLPAQAPPSEFNRIRQKILDRPAVAQGVEYLARDEHPHITLPPQFIWSPSDLVHFYKSEVISWFDRQRAEQHAWGNEAIEQDQPDDMLVLLRQKGMAHEAAYLDKLVQEGKRVAKIPDTVGELRLSFAQRHTLTLKAMADGYDIVYQAALKKDRFEGYADFLVRMDNPPGVTSAFHGNYHYEVWDTKLAHSAKPEHVLQLCCYAEMLEDIQGVRPQHIGVVTGTGDFVELPTNDFFYFYKVIKQMFLVFQREFNPEQTPFIGKGDYDNWNGLAEKIRLEQDWLSQLCGITERQIQKIVAAGLKTLTDLANTEITSIPGMDDQTFARYKLRARLQIASRGKEKPEFAVITDTPRPGVGLAALPPPSKMDVVLDTEGTPFVGNGLEYLFVALTKESGKQEFHTWWSDNEEEEKLNFEALVDFIYARWKSDPNMHVKHYGHHEVSSVMLKISSKYGTREAEVDELLKNNVFVDLYRVVEQGLVAGTPSDSLKYIERLYRPARKGEITKATSSIVQADQYFETDDPETREALKKNITFYCQDDCDSTGGLDDFLQEQKEKHGIPFLPPEPDEKTELELLRKFDNSRPIPNKNTPQLIEETLARYKKDIRRGVQRGQVVELLTHLLNYHAREFRVFQADLLRRLQMKEDELIADGDCLGGLERVDVPPWSEKNSLVFRYAFPADQETKITDGDTCFLAHNPKVTVEVHKINFEQGFVDIKISRQTLKKFPDEPPATVSLIPNDHVPPGQIHDTLYRIVSGINQDNPTIGQALHDLIYRQKPRILDTAKTAEDGEKMHVKGDLIKGDVYAKAKDGNDTEFTRVLKNMDQTTLFIQGPPGSGKTTLSAQAIVALLKDGNRVGLSGPSHKAIGNLLKKAADLAREQGVALNAVKVGELDEEAKQAGIQVVRSSSELFRNFDESINLVAGTPWVFAHERAHKKFSHLFVDEAGQVPLAHAVAMSPSAANLVFVGDPEQLEQPTRANHPKGSGKSVFAYYLDKFKGRQTLPDHAGIFLPKTFRLHPVLAQFISENFYEGRLEPAPNTAHHVLLPPATGEKDPPPLAGILFYAVAHADNKRSSPEEVDAMGRLIASLEHYLVSQTGKTGEAVTRPLTLNDILIVAPYNAQVLLAKRGLGHNKRIGTVDKFQGQEAPVTLISMSASTGGSGRGIDFLLNPHRLNVAISRAQALVVFFGNPQLAHVKPRTLKDWRLLNRMCRIMEEYEFTGIPTFPN